MMSEEVKNGKIVDGYGTVRWYKDGNLHRDEGPAIEWTNGTKEWLVNGKLHREDGPAVEYPAGTELWYQQGKIHNEDGPAVVRKGGSKEWWMNGKKYTEEEFNYWLAKKQLNERLAEQSEEKPIGKKVKI